MDATQAAIHLTHAIRQLATAANALVRGDLDGAETDIDRASWTLARATEELRLAKAVREVEQTAGEAVA